MAAKKEDDRCWPGYEPVKGKKPNSQGSCRPKADSKSTPSEKKFKAKRSKQLDNWESSHPGSPRKSAQHLGAPGVKKKSAAKATKKASAPKSKPAKKAPAR